MLESDDITLPLRHRTGTPAVIKARFVAGDYAVKTAWVLPGGIHVDSRREAYKSGMAMFKAAGWK